MSYSASSRYSYEERRSLGSHALSEIEHFARLEPQHQPLLDLILSWLSPAHQDYLSAYQALKIETSEDKKAAQPSEKSITDLLAEGIEEIFDAFEILLRKAKLSKNKDLLASVQLSIQSLTEGKTKSDLNTLEKQSLFLDDLQARLPQHPHLHLQSPEIDLLSHLQTLHSQAHSSKKGLLQEKAETHKARRTLWEKAEIWDTEFSASKTVLRGLLIHLSREDELKRFFKDTPSSRSPSSPTEEPPPSPES